MLQHSNSILLFDGPVILGGAELRTDDPMTILREEKHAHQPRRRFFGRQEFMQEFEQEWSRIYTAKPAPFRKNLRLRFGRLSAPSSWPHLEELVQELRSYGIYAADFQAVLAVIQWWSQTQYKEEWGNAGQWQHLPDIQTAVALDTMMQISTGGVYPGIDSSDCDNSSPCEYEAWWAIPNNSMHVPTTWRFLFVFPE